MFCIQIKLMLCETFDNCYLDKPDNSIPIFEILLWFNHSVVSFGIMGSLMWDPRPLWSSIKVSKSGNDAKNLRSLQEKKKR